MSFIRLLMGRRKFLVGSASAALTMSFSRIAGIFGLLSPANAARAQGAPQPIVNKKLKGIVVYYSATGNTATIANAIYKGMKSVISCDIVQVKKMDPKKMAKYDVMAIGSPNWYFREPAVFRTFTDDLPRLDGKHCVIFGTHGTMPIGQFWSISRNPVRKGVTVIGWCDWYGPDFLTPTHTLPHPAWGHPDSIDIAEAEAFGKRMAEYSVQIYAGKTELIPEIPKPDLNDKEQSIWAPRAEGRNITFAGPPPGSVPQFDLSKCVYPRCTQCEDNCPANAIDLSVLARATSVTPENSILTQDKIFAKEQQDWTIHPAIGQSASLVVKNACMHCGGMCQRVCNYDAIAYLGENGRIVINKNKCTYPKCTICSDLCTMSAIDLTKNPPVVHNRCEVEGLCFGVCPYDAIEIPRMAAEVRLSGQRGGGQMNRDAELMANPRFRSLTRKEDVENPIRILTMTSYPRIPIKSDLWVEHIENNS